MPDRILRRPEVERITGMGRSALYAAMQEGRFPRPVKLGPRAVGWRESEVQAWIDSLSRDTGEAA
ncbi:hypothetical protein KBTX_02459 [wastewater metagenome]|uniref:Prophage CP4-57 regulatory protein (AlpA) n=2 Tax=unclassified sequences TaxID=12908 RepID=A0A5B8RAA1_9ZZZZ|nr:AlpA family transcriptional regulator [Arhodomonas sp. KWT]QEA06129.1 hypothetical protein KBTEX_02459 [uncultured organism]